MKKLVLSILIALTLVFSAGTLVFSGCAFKKQTPSDTTTEDPGDDDENPDDDGNGGDEDPDDDSGSGEQSGLKNGGIYIAH